MLGMQCNAMEQGVAQPESGAEAPKAAGMSPIILPNEPKPPQYVTATLQTQSQINHHHGFAANGQPSQVYQLPANQQNPQAMQNNQQNNNGGYGPQPVPSNGIMRPSSAPAPATTARK